jgi:hypothetical protein
MLLIAARSMSDNNSSQRVLTMFLFLRKDLCMNRLRVASTCFVVALISAPLSVHAQGPNANNLPARVQALEAAVAALTARVGKLEGNISATDLVGSYSVYLLAVAMDPPGTVAAHNQVASYTIVATATLTADFRCSLLGTAAGMTITEQAPNLNWTPAEGVSGAGGGGCSWSYDDGVLTVNFDPGVEFNDFDLSVTAGGRVLVSAHGGPPSNNQQLTVWIRRP